MSIWSKLFGKHESKPVPPCEQKSAQQAGSPDTWDLAIAAAENGQRTVALEAFRSAIESFPDYYINVIEPSSARARACWKLAVERYRREADAKTVNSKAAGNLCTRCQKDIGTQWHYRFESLALDQTVGAQCPECGLVLCSDDLKFGADKNYEPCPKCDIRLVMLGEGPASSSMVEQASLEGRYRGAIKEPSVLGRPVEIR